MYEEIITQTALIIPKGKNVTIIDDTKHLRKPNFAMVGNGTKNKDGVMAINLLREMTEMSKPAQYTMLWLIDEVTWENKTGEVKISMAKFTNAQQQQFKKGFKELSSKNLMKRTKRSHYIFNPNALIPLDYELALELWSNS